MVDERFLRERSPGDVVFVRGVGVVKILGAELGGRNVVPVQLASGQRTLATGTALVQREGTAAEVKQFQPAPEAEKQFLRSVDVETQVIQRDEREAAFRSARVEAIKRFRERQEAARRPTPEEFTAVMRQVKAQREAAGDKPSFEQKPLRARPLDEAPSQTGGFQLREGAQEEIAQLPTGIPARQERQFEITPRQQEQIVQLPTQEEVRAKRIAEIDILAAEPITLVQSFVSETDPFGFETIQAALGGVVLGRSTEQLAGDIQAIRRERAAKTIRQAEAFISGEKTLEQVRQEEQRAFFFPAVTAGIGVGLAGIGGTVARVGFSILGGTQAAIGTEEFLRTGRPSALGGALLGGGLTLIGLRGFGRGRPSDKGIEIRQSVSVSEPTLRQQVGAEGRPSIISSDVATIKTVVGQKGLFRTRTETFETGVVGRGITEPITPTAAELRFGAAARTQVKGAEPIVQFVVGRGRLSTEGVEAPFTGRADIVGQVFRAGKPTEQLGGRFLSRRLIEGGESNLQQLIGVTARAREGVITGAELVGGLAKEPTFRDIPQPFTRGVGVTIKPSKQLGTIQTEILKPFARETALELFQKQPTPRPLVAPPISSVVFAMETPTVTRQPTAQRRPAQIDRVTTSSILGRRFRVVRRERERAVITVPTQIRQPVSTGIGLRPPVQMQEQIQEPIQTPIQIQIPAVTQRPAQRQRQRLLQPSPTRPPAQRGLLFPLSLRGFGFGRGGGLPVFGLTTGERRRRDRRKVRAPRRRTPSLIAREFDIRGLVGAGEITGLQIRPIVRRRRKR